MLDAPAARRPPRRARGQEIVELIVEEGGERTFARGPVAEDLQRARGEVELHVGEHVELPLLHQRLVGQAAEVDPLGRGAGAHGPDQRGADLGGLGALARFLLDAFVSTSTGARSPSARTATTPSASPRACTISASGPGRS